MIKKLWHIGDSHTYHELLIVPENIDIVIFSGDCSNPKNLEMSYQEIMNFIYWFSKLNIKYKIFVAGNHDTAIYKNVITKKDFKDNGIIYLENETIEVLGLKIFGSPFVPTFGDWSFMKNRSKIAKIWEHIDLDTDIVITHTPPKGILDISIDRYHNIEMCGCSALRKRINKVNPKLHCFGHIHNCKGVTNSGLLKLSNSDTIFSNGSIVTDNEFGKLSSNGNIIEI